MKNKPFKLFIFVSLLILSNILNAQKRQVCRINCPDNSSCSTSKSGASCYCTPYGAFCGKTITQLPKDFEYYNSLNAFIRNQKNIFTKKLFNKYINNIIRNIKKPTEKSLNEFTQNQSALLALHKKLPISEQNKINNFFNQYYSKIDYASHDKVKLLIKDKSVFEKNGILNFKNKKTFISVLNYLNNHQSIWDKENPDVEEPDAFLINFEENFKGFHSLRSQFERIEDSIWDKNGILRNKDLIFENGLEDDEVNTILNKARIFKIGKFIYYNPSMNKLFQIPDLKDDQILFKEFTKDTTKNPIIPINPFNPIRPYNILKDVLVYDLGNNESPFIKDDNPLNPNTEENNECDFGDIDYIVTENLGCGEYKITYDSIQYDQDYLDSLGNNLPERIVKNELEILDENGDKKVISNTDGEFNYEFPIEDLPKDYSVNIIATFESGCIITSDSPHNIKMPGLKLDFEKQMLDNCKPKNLKFTSVIVYYPNGNQPIANDYHYLWEVTKNNSTIASSEDKEPNFDLSSQENGDYNVQLTIRFIFNGKECSKKINKKVTFSDLCNSDFNVQYYGCTIDLASDAVSFVFTNHSTGGKCALFKLSVWNDPQGAPIFSSSIGNGITEFTLPYSSKKNKFKFILQMLEDNNVVCSKIKEITIVESKFDFTVKDCNNGSAFISYDSLVNDNVKFEFTGEVYKKNNGLYEIKYNATGNYEIIGIHQSENGSICKIVKTIFLEHNKCCYRNVSARLNKSYDYNGNKIRLKYKSSFHNYLGIINSYFKTKTKVKKGKKFVNSTYTKIEGKYFKKENGENGCKCFVPTTVFVEDLEGTNKKSKIYYKTNVTNARIKDNSIKSTHIIKFEDGTDLIEIFEIGNQDADSNILDWNNECGDN